MSSDILDYFPITEKIKAPRDTQVTVLNQVDKLISEGKRKIIICAPTGSGKSGIAIALLRKYGGTYTSPLNALVDQIKNDFEVRYAITLKGRSHYKCNAKMGYVTCDDGYCQSKVCSLDGVSKRECKKCDKLCACSSCEYTKQKMKYRDSLVGNTNFSMFQIGFKKEQPLLVIDESDDIESFIRLHNKVTLDECIISNDFLDHLPTIQETEVRIADRIAEIDEIRESNTIDSNVIKQVEYWDQINKEYKKLTRKHQQLIRLLEDYDENHKAWCISYSDNIKTSYEPISVDRFFNQLVEGKTTILMSATPKRIDGFEYIEVESSFPAKIRPWKFIPVGKMSSSYRDDSIPNVANFISKLVGKTVVHCNAYSVAKELGRELTIKGKCPLVQVNYESMNPMECGRKDIIKRFKDDPDDNQVLLSVNLARGVDFPELDIVNNVIAVIPFYNHTDRLVKAKNKMFTTSWQHPEMANTIMQAYGRVNRNDKKSTMTYILDTNFNDSNGRGVTKNWFDRHRHLFFNWFLEAEQKHNTDMDICPVCGNDVDNVYIVSYVDYSGKICHECNKTMDVQKETKRIDFDAFDKYCK